MVFQCLVSDHIHYGVIKHQTTWHETSRIIITYLFLFQWIIIGWPFYIIFFYGDKNVMTNGVNLIFWYFLLEWIQPCNLVKSLLMDIQCELKTITFSNGFFYRTNSLIKWEDWTEHSSSALEQYCESYISVFFVEVNSWLNSLDDPVNMLPRIYWMWFTHISGGRCDYFLY